MKIPSATAIVGAEESWTLKQMSGDPYSLYFHIPFCSKKCDYCHFYVIPDKEHFKKSYMEALEIEWKLQSAQINEKHSLQSIYFGGGTPSLLGAERIAKILSWVQPLPHVEISLEVNPENVTFELMQAYAMCGVNRVSLGLQSLDDSLLKLLGRTHSANKSIEAVYTIQSAGIENISIDLMYDLPKQTLFSWEETLKKTLLLPITHLSLYNLTIEPHTVFFKKQTLLRPYLPKEEESGSMLKLALNMIQEKFHRYEISAFCKDNLFSRHNLGYWTGRPFLGLGPSAFSYWHKKRFKNTSNLSHYTKKLKANELAIDFEEELENKEHIKELFVIGLRVLEGVDYPSFSKSVGSLDQGSLKTIDHLINENFLEKEAERIRLTERGQLFYDTLAAELI